MIVGVAESERGLREHVVNNQTIRMVITGARR